MSDLRFTQERLSPVEFAVIKEYFRVGGNYKGISDVTGLSVGQIKDIYGTMFYKDYMKKQDEYFIAMALKQDGDITPVSVE